MVEKKQSEHLEESRDGLSKESVRVDLTGKSLVIDGFTVNTSTHTISNDDCEVRMEPRVIDLLVYLAERQGKVVSREELESEIWKSMVVGYDALNSTIAKLRKAFGDDPKQPRIIQTVPKVGYQLIADVGVVESDSGKIITLDTIKSQPTEVSWRLIGIGLLLMAVIATLSWFKPWIDNNYPKRPTEPSLVVLPLENLSNDRSQDALSVAISEGITSGLSRFRDLFVISSDSANVYTNGDYSPKLISKELGVRFLLTGNMQRSGDSLRINMQLVDADSQSTVWTENYNRVVNDLFQIQDEIVSQVTATLGEEIWQSAASKLDEKPISDFSSVDFLLKAKDIFHELTRESTHQARTLIQSAIDLDPEQGRPYLMMAWTYYLEFRAQWEDTDPDALNKALDFIAQSENKMGRTHEIHRLLAKINQVSGNFEQALLHSEEALQKNPNDGDLLATHAQMLTRAGRSKEAIHWSKEAIRRNPHYPPWYAAALAIAQYLVGDYREAVMILEKSGDLPVWGLRYLIAGYAQLGELEKAKEPIQLLLEQSPNFSVSGFEDKVEFQLDSDKQHFLDGLRKAGLPE